jgi:regulator of protease activity HflC (stomatin/prohibitin superfamily)
MARYRMSNIDDADEQSGGGPPPLPPRPPRPGGRPALTAGMPSFTVTVVGLALLLGVAYLVYLWFFVRIVVGPDEVLVLIRKDGSRSLPGREYVIPSPPDTSDTAAYAAWEKQYGDCNGILEEPLKPGTYFGYSPLDYEREIVKVRVIQAPQIGLVIRKFGEPLRPGQILADLDRPQAGPLPVVLPPGSYPQYSNPYAFEIKQVDPVTVPPGHRGVVTIMAGRAPAQPNEYLVANGEQGVQAQPEKEGLFYVNLYEKRIMPISVQSQRLEMSGSDAIQFPSADSFEIRMEGFVEWRIKSELLPLMYVQYGEGGGLIEQLEERVILPYSRSFSRLVGSQFPARDFISGDTKLKFQAEFEHRLREACAHEGVEILQALVRDIIPPDDIKNPINEREIAKQQIRTLEQQIQVARSSADLARQQELATQNQRLGDANKEVVTLVTKAQQDANVAITQAQQELAVARLRLEAAQKEADARIAGGQAAAKVILLNKEAEARPLRDQVAAFGGGDAFAQYHFFQKVAPAIKSILTTTDGVFADLFRDILSGSAAPAHGGQE